MYFLQVYGGTSFPVRLYRAYYEGKTALYDMWMGNPVLTSVLFGLPMGFLSLICYSVCCADIMDAEDEEPGNYFSTSPHALSPRLILDFFFFQITKRKSEVLHYLFHFHTALVGFYTDPVNKHAFLSWLIYRVESRKFKS